MTRDEVRDVIRDEVQSVVQSHVQSLVDYVAEVQHNITTLLLNAINPGSEYNPAASCTNIPQRRPSGAYWIQCSDNSASQQYCDMTQSTCCSFNNPPWFCKELPQPTRDDIELRLCADQATSDEDTPLEVVEIYIQ